MFQADDAGEAGGQPGPGAPGIPMPPAPGGDMVVQGAYPTAVGATERSATVVGQPEVALLFLRGKLEVIDPPGMRQSPERAKDVRVSPGPDPPWDHLLPCFSPPGKSDEP
jgi:hypothetical protein